MYGAMRSLEFTQNHNHTAFYFCDHICGVVYKMQFEICVYFSNFRLFLFSPKLFFFPFVLGQVLGSSLCPMISDHWTR